MKEHIQYDDIFKQKLSEHESAVPEDMFDRLMQKRTVSEESVDKILQHKLTEYESDVPRDLFDSMMFDRDSRGSSVDKIMQHKLTEHESDVPRGMFEQLMFEREIDPHSADKIIQHKLTQHESEIPSDMFERIMAEREKRRPVVAWWHTNQFRGVVAALILTLLAGGYWFETKNKITSGSVVIDDTNDSKTNKNSLHTEGVSQSSQYDNSASSSTIDNNITIGKNTETASSNPRSQNLVSTKAIVEKSNSINKVKSIKGHSSSASNSTKITSNFISPKISTNNLISESSTLLPSSETSQPVAAIEETEKKDIFLGLNPLTKGAAKGITQPPLNHDKVTKALPCPGPDYGCPTFGKKNAGKMHWYVDGYVAPEYAIRSLKALSTEYNEYRMARDTVEKVLYAFGGGVRATAIMDNGFLLRGGLVYSQNNERFRKDSLILDYVEYTVRTNPQTGQSDTVAINLVDAIRRQIRYNRYRTLDFTIQAGYEYPLTDALTLGLNAGVNINVLTRLKGTVLGQDLQPTVLSTTNTIYQTSVGTSVIGSVAAYWRFSEKWQLMIEPQVRYFMRPITKADYVLRQSYVNMGLHVGVRYRLF